MRKQRLPRAGCAVLGKAVSNGTTGGIRCVAPLTAASNIIVGHTKHFDGVARPHGAAKAIGADESTP